MGDDPTIEATYTELAMRYGRKLMKIYPEAKELDVIRMIKDGGHEHMVAVGAAETLFKEQKANEQ